MLPLSSSQALGREDNALAVVAPRKAPRPEPYQLLALCSPRALAGREDAALFLATSRLQQETP
jgi:hypothetical protein